MYLNIVHRMESELPLHAGVRFQQEACHRLGLRTTLLIGYPAMDVPELVDYARAELARGDVELGVTLHDMDCEEIRALTGSSEWMFYMLDEPSRRKVLDACFARFESVFGFKARSVAAYILDAPTLRYLHSAQPQAIAAITNCFEEGVKMYEGNDHRWMLFCDGGPWGAYYPSKRNHIAPARDADDAVGVVGLPHLNRDMVLSLTSRDDYFSSHPLNIIRAKADAGGHSPYGERFYRQWLAQEAINGYAYYSMFVSAAWVTDGYQRLFLPDHDAARALYAETLEMMRRSVDRGETVCCTMSEFARWFKQNVPVGRRELTLWRDILCGSKRQTFWYCDGFLRAAVDMNQGGALVDLRAFTVENAIGPDQPRLWNGANPYLLSNEHRCAIHACELEYRGRRYLAQNRRCSAEALPGDVPTLALEPVTFDADGDTLTLVSTLRFPGSGRVELRRRVLAPDGATVLVRERFHGTFGYTQYPEDMRGILLEGAGDSRLIRWVYAYKGRLERFERPRYVQALLPQGGVRVRLVADPRATLATLQEGTLFSSDYELTTETPLQNGEEAIACLELTESR